jgi:hypothetical protein
LTKGNTLYLIDVTQLRDTSYKPSNLIAKMFPHISQIAPSVIYHIMKHTCHYCIESMPQKVCYQLQNLTWQNSWIIEMGSSPNSPWNRSVTCEQWFISETS